MNSLKQKLLLIFLFLLSSHSNSLSAACLTAEIENNNSQSNANSSVCSQVLIEGSINNRRDTDWFQIQASSGTLTVTLNHNNRDDFDFNIVDQNGNTLLNRETSQVPETGSIPIESDAFYIQITRYSGTGWYDLTLDFPESAGSGEPPSTSCQHGPRPNKPGSLRNWLSGSSNDKCVDIQGNQGVLLMGGNFDVDEAFEERVKPRINGGDVVVLRTSGSDGYNSYLNGLLNSDSVETLLLDSVSKANSDYVDWVIRSAEFVFIAGGDQADYLNQWKGTKVESALASVYSKGGVIGGTSAGAMVQGEWIYDPDGIYSVFSDEAVTDPCHQNINLSSGFLNTPFLNNLIVDTHFQQRDRMGRLTAFMSQMNSSAIGVGVDEDTSLFIDASGSAVVDGDNSVYILTEGSSTVLQQGQCGSPLIYNNIYRYKLSAGDSFNFAPGQASVSSLLIDIDGRQSNFYNPSNPY